MNPQMMQAAQEMMSKMSPEDMNRMMEMTKNMDPSMMAQAQQMMNNPAMMAQAQETMKNMSPDELKNKMNQMPGAAAAGGARRSPAAPAAPVSVVAKLRQSAMSVPEELIEVVEEAEGYKAQGNNRFKEGNYSAAASKYKQGSSLSESVIKKDKLSGVDLGAVKDLKEACHLNLANCRLKLEEWAAAEAECDTVLQRGKNRKAYFRRGQALLKQEKVQEAYEDLKKAVEMDPSDATVASMLADAEKRLGIEPSPARKPKPKPAPPASSAAVPGAPGAGGLPDPAQMEKMLDAITPEQMQQQAEMLEKMDPEQLKSMAPGLGNVDPSQLSMVSKMMKNMDPSTMKSMAKMAQQMQASGQMPNMGGMGGMGGAPSLGAAGAAAEGAGPSNATAGEGGMPSMSQGMDMMQNMSPEMMKAGMDMMKNMDPSMMASMGKMLGREISPDQMEQMQKVMSNMSEDDMAKWAGRAQTLARWGQKPMAVYRYCSAKLSGVSNGTIFGVLVCALGVMYMGHYSEAF